MRVAIDPGHGMGNRQPGVFDPGATHIENQVRHEEASIVLKYGLTLRDAFRARNHEVFMTRDDNEDHAPVGQRATNARNAGAQVFVSLHLNDAEVDSANGLEVLFRGNDDRALAQQLQTALVQVTGFRDREIKQRNDLAVLTFQGVAVLIELGFIANDQNRAVLLNPERRQAICDTIAEVVISHFN
ncbi:MAG TPA: N-acetylmuramoyl-L-alanine amidase [Pyrinomonadaceae bacterium]